MFVRLVVRPPGPVNLSMLKLFRLGVRCDVGLRYDMLRSMRLIR